MEEEQYVKLSIEDYNDPNVKARVKGMPDHSYHVFATLMDKNEAEFKKINFPIQDDIKAQNVNDVLLNMPKDDMKIKVRMADECHMFYSYCNENWYVIDKYEGLLVLSPTFELLRVYPYKLSWYYDDKNPPIKIFYLYDTTTDQITMVGAFQDCVKKFNFKTAESVVSITQSVADFVKVTHNDVIILVGGFDLSTISYPYFHKFTSYNVHTVLERMDDNIFLFTIRTIGNKDITSVNFSWYDENLMFGFGEFVSDNIIVLRAVEKNVKTNYDMWFMIKDWQNPNKSKELVYIGQSGHGSDTIRKPFNILLISSEHKINGK
jgi:hypothetical protein